MKQLRYLLKLAARNTVRNTRRSILTLIALIIGVGLFVVAQSFVDGIDLTVVGTEINAEHAHLRIVPNGYLEEEDYRPLDMPFPEAPKVSQLIETKYEGAKALTRIAFPAEIGDGQKSLVCRGLVIDPDAYQNMFRLGTLETKTPNEPHIWLGIDLAAAFDFKIGDRIILKSKTAGGTLNALNDVVVAGMFSAGHPLLDTFTVLMPEQHGRAFLDVDDNFATEVMVQFKDPYQAQLADALLAEKYPKLTSQTWQEKTQWMIELNKKRRGMFNIIVSVILLIAASGIANTCLMSGFERTTEIGTLLAVGMRKNQVLTLFIAESTLIGALGSVLGVLVGGLIAWYFTINGIPLPKEVAQQSITIPTPPILYFNLTFKTLGSGLGIGCIVALLASVYPALRASKLNPVEALRVEA